VLLVGPVPVAIDLLLFVGRDQVGEEERAVLLVRQYTLNRLKREWQHQGQYSVPSVGLWAISYTLGSRYPYYRYRGRLAFLYFKSSTL